MGYYVYILANRPGGAIYVGSTNDLRRRVEQHRCGAFPGHTSRYNIRTLVWFEEHVSYWDAAERERRIKRWARRWKDDLIMAVNPDWQDVTAQIPW